MVEQLTFNQLVAGSNPARPTISSQGNKKYGAIAQLGERLPCTQEVCGSIPHSSTIPSIRMAFIFTFKK
ncbi:conserved hypothetical protein [Vibrio crassostreae]|nr:conserved hypothetical protein [Vibrio crassostreae]CAK3954202.1 conserved hypothetical protein [Vibrio crassostreae]CAK4001748.1 conserved hypothetical protein [Vibrio crassostreae]